MHEARGRLVLRLLCGFRVCMCMCICTYHVRNNDVTYIVAMRSNTRLRQFRWLLCVAGTSGLPQLRLRDGYREAEAT